MRLSGDFPLSKLFLYQLPDNLFDLLILRYQAKILGCFFRFSSLAKATCRILRRIESLPALFCRKLDIA